MPEQSRDPTLRILLDENVDRLLKSHFHSDFEVVTVPECGWAGLSDGEMLRRADEQFDVLVTMGQNLPYQQNLPTYKVAMVVLKAPSNTFPDVVELMPRVNEQVRYAKEGEATAFGRVRSTAFNIVGWEWRCQWMRTAPVEDVLSH